MPIFCPLSELKRWSLNYFVLHRGIQCRFNIAISLLFQKAKQHLKCSICLPQLDSLWLVIRNLRVSLTMFRCSKFDIKQAFLKGLLKWKHGYKFELEAILLVECEIRGRYTEGTVS
jgi:hypothetical protein